MEHRVSLGEKSRSLASANDVKADEQSVFSEIHTIHAFGTPQGTLEHHT
jgi:hypothetical protein